MHQKPVTWCYKSGAGTAPVYYHPWPLRASRRELAGVTPRRQIPPVRLVRSLPLGYLFLLLVAAPAPLPAIIRRPSQALLERLLGESYHPDLRWADLADVGPDLRQLYASRGWGAVWYDNDTLTGPARSLIRVLAEAGNRGLDPTDYDAGWLVAAAALPGNADSVFEARVDLGLSVAAARLVRALRFGRVSPEAVHAAFHLPVDSLNVPALLDSLAGTPQPNDLLRSLEPPFIHYWLLMATLVRYRELARDSALVNLPVMPAHLRPGQSYPGIPTLRRLLRLLGDYRDSTPIPILDTVYAGEAVQGVKRFQMRQGFTPDGVIGDATRERLGHPFDQRIRQMELTMERWRWMPRRFPTPPILVNIPAFRLYAFETLSLREDSMLAMNVVVGTAYETETPVFTDELEYLIFAPYWDVTPTIAEKEIRPAALKDPAFLTRNRYELVKDGEPVSPWPEYIEGIGHGVRVRQIPGAHNALGRVKFIMPNDYQVYLHDTPARNMFERTRRDASHGCIRLGDPFALARFLLRDQPEWTEERIRAAMDAAEPITVRFRAPVPVYLTYATVMARPNGDVFFYPDIYGHDRTLDRLLRVGYPYPRSAAAPPPMPVASP